MLPPNPGRLRVARADDEAQLIELWAQLFDEDDAQTPAPWIQHSKDWFAHAVDDYATARFPVIEVGDEIVATGIGTLEIGVPNPQSPRGGTARLANVITVPEHRGNGYGALLVLDVVEWARSIAADRIDLSATPEGEHLYEKLGFVRTSAPRMKLVL